MSLGLNESGRPMMYLMQVVGGTGAFLRMLFLSFQFNNPRRAGEWGHVLVSHKNTEQCSFLSYHSS